MLAREQRLQRDRQRHAVHSGPKLDFLDRLGVKDAVLKAVNALHDAERDADENVVVDILAEKNSSAVQRDADRHEEDRIEENDIVDRKSTRLNSSHIPLSRMPS